MQGAACKRHGGARYMEDDRLCLDVRQGAGMLSRLGWCPGKGAAQSAQTCGDTLLYIVGWLVILARGDIPSEVGS